MKRFLKQAGNLVTPTIIIKRKMKSKNISLIALALGIFSASCTTNPKYSGTPLKLDEALIAVGDALQAADRQVTGGKNSGLVPAEVTVGFNITNASSDAGNVQLNVVPVPSTTIAGGWAGSRTSQIGSAITIKYSSLLLAGADSIVGSRPAAESNTLVRDISRENLALKRRINTLTNQNDELQKKILRP
jgi:hypothetical protein